MSTNVDTQLLNQSSLQTDYTKASTGFYSPGGQRDSQLKCQFICESPNMLKQNQPTLIELDLAPTGVSWDYNLRYQVYNTLGGQVIQILGVDIQNVKITGRFGFESWFGKHFSGSAWTSLYKNDSVGSSKPYVWDNHASFKNGLIQMAHWFRAYFNVITQPNYDQYPMYFSYPHRGWWWPIRPRAFPTIRFSQQDFAPYWTVEADYLQYLQDGTSSLEKTVISSVQNDLNNLNNGVGVYTDFLKFSDPQTAFGTADINTYAQKFGNSYSTYANAGTAAVDLYANNGFSVPITAQQLVDIGIIFPGGG
jgi:hypothetical protein